ncbi:MAG: hypothetical protein ACE15C_05415 [Phycisphaerae bacterium]
MTKPIEPRELSGLIDGELDAARALEVLQAVATDGALKTELAELKRSDHAWSSAAAKAWFAPKAALPSPGRRPGRAAMTAAGVLLLAAAWIMPKLVLAPAIMVVVHATALAITMAVLVSTAGNVETSGAASR